MRAKGIPAELRLLLENADVPRREKLEARIVKAVNACGCTSGSVAMTLAAGAAVVWWLLARDGRLVLWPEIGMAAVVVLAAAGGGKLLGLAAARTWLAWTAHELRREVRAAP